jgi:lipopolysaccharide transport system ATP-binding protein
MSTNAIIKVENLSKRYTIGELRSTQNTLRETIMETVNAPARLFSAASSNRETLWALSDVSFTVQPGEVVGIIGRNGAGKSTLLKVLSRLTPPTRGTVELYGRVNSLLEVGTGFHTELSGRENIFLNGALLGMQRSEIRERFDSIVGFAELDRFIDTAVKHYSSGMYMRLAFAVAAHLEPEILIVDEVLAVGDASFQKKCLGKMDSVAKQGCTVLLVSHNMAIVEKLCSRALVLEQGKLSYSGPTATAITNYLARDSNGPIDAAQSGASHSSEIRVTSVELRDFQGRPLDLAISGQDIEIWLNYESKSSRGERLIAAVGVATQFGTPVFLQHNRLTADEWGQIPARGAFVCRIPRLPLTPASYNVTYSLMRDDEYLDVRENAYVLNVADGDFFGSGEVPPATHGCCLVDATWRLESGSSALNSSPKEESALLNQ